jgi:GTP pyrophosphokinase
MNLKMDLKSALEFAHDHHQGQQKPGTNIPFIYHPLAVASLVLQYGGNHAQAQAAVLHDSIGDGKVTEADLASRFGEETARIVFGFADPALPDGIEPSWQNLRKAYLEKLKGLDEAVLLVTACEELHEIRELLHDLRYQGADGWGRFPVHSMEVFWYFRELLQIFHPRLKEPRHAALVSEFSSQVKSLKEIVFDGRSY